MTNHGRYDSLQLRAARTRRAKLGLALGVLVLCCGLATAQDDDASSADEQPVSTQANDASITLSDAGLLDVHMRDTPIAAVLEMLSYQVRTNIVTSPSVTGVVSANLYDVTLEEALDAILTPNQILYRKVGNVIYVGTREEMDAQRPPPPTRVIELNYLTRDEAEMIASGLLSDVGKIAKPQEEDTGTTGGQEKFDPASVERLIVTDHEENLDRIESLIHELDVRPKQVLIEATILRATLNEDNQFGIDLTLLNGVDFQNVSGSSNAVENLTLGQLPPEKFEKTTFNVNTDLIGGSPQTGFTFGIIKNSVAAFVRALESVNDVSVLANPKVVTLNRHEAQVIVGRRDGYLTTTVTETAAVQTVEFLETGTQIKLRPVINNDGVVRLDIQPKDSNGGLTAANLPFEETTEATAHLIVEDGHTVLIGGLFRERSVASRSQVPVLGDIPGLGMIFSKQLDQTVREEVIILLTVKVLEDSDGESDAMEELLNDVERIRVGTRRGLVGTGRERLAQAFYREALAQAERGHRGRALFNVRMSLYNQPRHIAAIKLKERLLGERDWESDGSKIRGFAMELIDESEGDREETPSRLGWPSEHRETIRGKAEDLSEDEEP